VGWVCHVGWAHAASRRSDLYQNVSYSFWMWVFVGAC
jgi:hypothetical protein